MIPRPFQHSLLRAQRVTGVLLAACTIAVYWANSRPSAPLNPVLKMPQSPATEKQAHGQANGKEKGVSRYLRPSLGSDSNFYRLP